MASPFSSSIYDYDEKDEEDSSLKRTQEIQNLNLSKSESISQMVGKKNTAESERMGDC